MVISLYSCMCEVMILSLLFPVFKESSLLFGVLLLAMLKASCFELPLEAVDRDLSYASSSACLAACFYCFTSFLAIDVSLTFLFLTSLLDCFSVVLSYSALCPPPIYYLT